MLEKRSVSVVNMKESGGEVSHWRAGTRLSRGIHRLPAANGAVWVVVALAVPRFLGAVLTVLLRRFLGPAASGTFDLAYTPYKLLDTFRSFGTGPALVYEHTMSNELADTAWTINMIAAVLITLLAQIVAEPVARYYGHPAIETVVRVLSIAYVFGSLTSVHYFLLLRDLNFRARSVPPIGQVVAAGTVAVLFALWGFGVGSLVAREVASAAAGAALLWAVHPFRPRVRLVPQLARRLLGYGVWVGGGLALLYLAQNADLFIGGRLIRSTGAIGFYTTSWTLAFMVAGILTVLVGNVVFPTLSRLQHDVVELRAKLLNGLQQVSLVLCPASVLLACLAPVIIVPVLGAKFAPYRDLFAVLTLLALYAALRTLLAVFFEGYKAIGKPWLVPAYNGAKLCVLVPSMIVGAHYGVMGLALGYTPVEALEIPGALILAFWALGIRPTEVWTSIRVPMIATVIMAAVAVGVESALVGLTHGSDTATLIVSFMLAASTYILVLRLADRTLLSQARLVLLAGL